MSYGWSGKTEVWFYEEAKFFIYLFKLLPNVIKGRCSVNTFVLDIELTLVLTVLVRRAVEYCVSVDERVSSLHAMIPTTFDPCRGDVCSSVGNSDDSNISRPPSGVMLRFFSPIYASADSLRWRTLSTGSHSTHPQCLASILHEQIFVNMQTFAPCFPICVPILGGN